MKIYRYFFILFPLLVSAQVGIKTTTPNTFLDVNGAITNRELSFDVVANAVSIDLETSLASIIGNATSIVNVTSYTPTIDGHRLIISNNTTGGFEAIFYGNVIPNNQAIEFAFINGTWKSSTAIEALFANIYNTSDALTSNRIVTQGSNSLSFTNNIVDGFNIDNPTFSVDGLNNQMGIGTINPSAKLDIVSNGSTSTTKALEINNSSATEMITVLDNGNVGVRQINPIVPFQYGSAMFIGKGGVIGDSNIGSDISFSAQSVLASESNFTINIDADNNQVDAYFSVNNNSDNSLISNELMRVQENGNVGIGTTTPVQLLDVNGNIRMGVNGSIYYQNLPDYRLVIREDFETTAVGWTNNTRTLVLGQRILGGYNLASTANQKTFDLTGIPHTNVKIKFTYYSIDSWESETAFVKVVGTGAVWKQQFNWNNLNRENITGNAIHPDEIAHGEIELPHTSNSLTLIIDAILDSIPSDESYGIDNIEIWVR